MSSSCCCDCSPKSEPAETAITSAEATEAAAQQLIAKSEKSECCNEKPAKSEKHSCGC